MTLTVAQCIGLCALSWLFLYGSVWVQRPPLTPSQRARRRRATFYGLVPLLYYGALWVASAINPWRTRGAAHASVVVTAAALAFLALSLGSFLAQLARAPYARR